MLKLYLTVIWKIELYKVKISEVGKRLPWSVYSTIICSQLLLIFLMFLLFLFFIQCMKFRFPSNSLLGWVVSGLRFDLTGMTRFCVEVWFGRDEWFLGWDLIWQGWVVSGLRFDLTGMTGFWVEVWFGRDEWFLGWSLIWQGWVVSGLKFDLTGLTGFWVEAWFGSDEWFLGWS